MTAAPPVTVRFAPSPTGKLHVGNVRAALWNWLFAKGNGGRFILRIDDTDKERSTLENEERIRRDLTWLGLTWDDTFRQSERFARYDVVADALRAEGLLYPCFETAEELERKRRLQLAQRMPPVYDRAALALSDDQRQGLLAAGRAPHWRYRLSGSAVRWRDMIRGECVVETASLSDPVLIREDGMYLYTLPSCIDDVDYAISHVIRGEDHVTNTGVQVEIMAAILRLSGAGALPQFAHHSLLIGADGQGLSKRLGSLSLEAMREEGLEPAAVTSLLARLGTSAPVVAERDLAALAHAFTFDGVGRAPARFDEADLRALNARVLHETPFEAVAARLAALGVSEQVWRAARGNIDSLAGAVRWRDVIEGTIRPVMEELSVLAAAVELVPDDPLAEHSWAAFTDAVKAKTGAKGKGLFRPLRLALTGEETGPEMQVLFPLIGAAKARARLRGERA